MSLPRIPLAFALSLLFAVAAWRWLRSTGPPASPLRRTLGAASAFLAALFALKIPALVGRPPGLLRGDFLYPLWARWETGTAWWWLVVALALGAAILESWRRGFWHRLEPPAFDAGLAVAAATLWTAMALSNGGWPEGVIAPFLREADYLADVPRFDAPSRILETYVERQPGLSLHGKTHPPGAVLLLTALHRLFGGSTPAIALAVIAIGATGVVPVRRLATRLLDEASGKDACLLWVFTPAVLLYGATCMDMVFAVPIVAALSSAASWNAAATRAVLWRRGAATGAWLALGFGFTFSTALAAVAIAVAARRRWAPLAAAAVVSAGLLLAAKPLAGFDAIACFRTAVAIDAADAPAFHSLRYYALTRMMGVLDFLLLAGIGSAPLWLSGLRRPAAGPEPARDLGRAAAVAAVVFLAAGAYKIGETGRIGLFLIPVVAAGVAARGAAFARAAAGLGFVQALIFEHFLDTRW